jgi:FMN phosphatase YigB (HAD superfamily)
MTRRDARQEAMMTAPPRLTIFVDVDNTLIDNDAAKEEMDQRLAAVVGLEAAKRFWTVYEEVRQEFGVVDIPRALARFEAENEHNLADLARRAALAGVFMDFPFREYLYPEALATLAHLRSLGRVAILSDGDGVFQPVKIARSGLADAVDGYVLVYPHKEAHHGELEAIFPADHYVLIDDKLDVLRRFRERSTAPLTTVFVRQGKYAAAAGPPPWPGADTVVERIGDLLGYDKSKLIGL